MGLRRTIRGKHMLAFRLRLSYDPSETTGGCQWVDLSPRSNTTTNTVCAFLGTMPSPASPQFEASCPTSLPPGKPLIDSASADRSEWWAVLASLAGFEPALPA